MSVIDHWRVGRIPAVAFPAIDRKTLIAGAAALVYVLMNAAIIAGAVDCVAGEDSLLCGLARFVAQ